MEEEMKMFWISHRKNAQKKFESAVVRQAKMPLDKVIKELLISLEKLQYKILRIEKHRISLKKHNPSESKDIHTVSVVGEPQEIEKILDDERIAKFLEK